jgi:hypothetical protein
VVIPTIGRLSLNATLQSLLPQVGRGDEVVVMRDGGFDPVCHNLCRTYQSVNQARWTHDFTNGDLGAFGHPARNRAIDTYPNAEFFWSLDDDDVALSGALDAMRAAIDDARRTPASLPFFVFQMQGGANSHFPGRTVPVTGHEIRPGNVGTPMLLWPNCSARFGTEAHPELPFGEKPGYYGDLDMTLALQEELGPPVWVDTPVAMVRP